MILDFLKLLSHLQLKKHSINHNFIYMLSLIAKYSTSDNGDMILPSVSYPIAYNLYFFPEIFETRQRDMKKGFYLRIPVSAQFTYSISLLYYGNKKGDQRASLGFPRQTGRMLIYADLRFKVKLTSTVPVAVSHTNDFGISRFCVHGSSINVRQPEG